VLSSVSVQCHVACCNSLGQTNQQSDNNTLPQCTLPQSTDPCSQGRFTTAAQNTSAGLRHFTCVQLPQPHTYCCGSTLGNCNAVQRWCLTPNVTVPLCQPDKPQNVTQSRSATLLGRKMPRLGQGTTHGFQQFGAAHHSCCFALAYAIHVHNSCVPFHTPASNEPPSAARRSRTNAHGQMHTQCAGLSHPQRILITQRRCRYQTTQRHPPPHKNKHQRQQQGLSTPTAVAVRVTQATPRPSAHHPPPWEYEDEDTIGHKLANRCSNRHQAAVAPVCCSSCLHHNHTGRTAPNHQLHIHTGHLRQHPFHNPLQAP